MESEVDYAGVIDRNKQRHVSAISQNECFLCLEPFKPVFNEGFNILYL